MFLFCSSSGTHAFIAVISMSVDNTTYATSDTFLKRLCEKTKKRNISGTHFESLLTQFRMDFFGAAHECGEEAKRPSSQKSVTHILQ